MAIAKESDAPAINVCRRESGSLNSLIVTFHRLGESFSSVLLTQWLSARAMIGNMLVRFRPFGTRGTKTADAPRATFFGAIGKGQAQCFGDT